MNESKKEKQRIRDQWRAKVYHTKKQYNILRKDSLKSGKSIPTLLKETYRKNPISAPRLTKEKGLTVVKDLHRLGQNLNVATRNVNSGDVSTIKADIDEFGQGLRCLTSYLGLKNENSYNHW